MLNSINKSMKMKHTDLDETEKSSKKVSLRFKNRDMRKAIQILLIFLLPIAVISCNTGTDKPDSKSKEDKSSLVKKRRDDGTLSSVNTVDENGYVHGVKTNFYEDGKTIHSKISYENGRKHGPAIWYFKNGQIYEHTTFYLNRKNGLTKRYYETGELMEEITFNSGEELAGKKKYSKDGALITR